jgi:hypothetical protein
MRFLSRVEQAELFVQREDKTPGLDSSSKEAGEELRELSGAKGLDN